METIMQDLLIDTGNLDVTAQLDTIIELLIKFYALLEQLTGYIVFTVIIAFAVLFIYLIFKPFRHFF